MWDKKYSHIQDTNVSMWECFDIFKIYILNSPSTFDKVFCDSGVLFSGTFGLSYFISLLYVFLSDAVGRKYPKVSSKNCQEKLHLIKKKSYQQATEKMNNILVITMYMCCFSYSAVTYDYLCGNWCEK